LRLSDGKGEGTMVRFPNSIDYGRIEIEQNELA